MAYLEGHPVYEMNVICFETLRVLELPNNLWIVGMESDMVSRRAEVSAVYLSACVALTRMPRSITT